MAKSIFSYQSPNGISYAHSFREPTAEKASAYHAESHPNIEIMLLLSGCVDYSINGATYRIHAGDFIIINSWEFHTSIIDSSLPYEHINLHFSPDFIPKLKNVDLTEPFFNTRLYQHIIPKELVKKSNIEKIMKGFEYLCADPTKYKDAKIISLIQDLVVEINTTVETLLTKEYHLIPTPKSTNELLQTTIKYINSHQSETITTAEIAAELGISESYLYRIFKNQMGVSLHDYIQNQKMQLALSLIRKGYLPQNAAEMLGYDYYATFFTQFKRVFGKTPNQFK